MWKILQQIHQAMLTVSQLIIFNITIQTQKDSSQEYHTTKREPSIAVYLGQLLHSQTRKLGLV